MAKSGLLAATKAQNTTANTVATTASTSNKATNPVGGLTVGVQAINTAEITRGQAALTSNQG